MEEWMIALIAVALGIFMFVGYKLFFPSNADKQ